MPEDVYTRQFSVNGHHLISNIFAYPMKMHERPTAARVNFCTHLRWALLVLYICMTINADAQFQRYRNFDVKDGLPSSEVYDVLQDSKGFLWFSTDLGVSRYDGYEFRNFTTENGLPDNTIFKMYEDHAGRIWFTSFSGKLSYFLNDRIYSLPCNDVLTKTTHGYFFCSIYVDRGDTIWAGTTSGMSYSIAPGWTAGDVDSSAHSRGSSFLKLIDGVGFIYGGGMMVDSSLSVYNKVDEKIYSIGLPDVKGTEVGRRMFFMRLSDGNFLATANAHIITFNSSGVLHSAELNAIGISSTQLPDGSVVTGTYSGIEVWSDAQFNSRRTTSKFDQKIVTDVLRDTEGGMWYCTEGNGVYCSANSTFLYYTADDGLPETKITSAAIHGDIIYTGHIDGSICRLQGQSVRRLIPETAEDYPGTSNRITSIIEFNEHEVLASTANCYYAIGTSDSKVRTIQESGCKKMILGQDRSILAFRFRRLTTFSNAELHVLDNVGFSLYADNIYQDRSYTTWICAINGLWTCDSMNHLKYLGDSIPDLATRVTAITQSADGIIWAATRGSGVVMICKDTVYRVQRSDGLASNMCRSLYVDDKNTIWVGTTSGLSRLQYSLNDSLHYQILNYTSENGLLSNDVNEIVGAKDRLWLIHTSGISVFNPAEVPIGKFAPPVYITGIMVNGDSVSAADSSFGYEENGFSFSFVGLSFRDPGKINYRYKLEGADHEWIYTKVTSATYQTLEHGDYRFIVQASSNEGVWSTKEAAIGFTIAPAWWQTWLFRTAIVFLIALLIYVGFRARVRQIRNREEKKSALQNRIASFELNALRAQMNPHFVFNAINSVQYFITENDPDSSQRYLTKFAKLIRYVVDNSRLSYISVKAEIEALTLYLELESLRFGKRMTYSFEIGDEVDIEFVQIPSMIIQPYVENSIWHGIMHKEGAGEIKIKFSIVDDMLNCVIEDDGVGREKSREIKMNKPHSTHKSVGMTNTRERLEIINQVSNTNVSVTITDLYSENNTACGTRVEFKVPVNHN